ncbi:MAG: hypothetical protein AAF228_10500 [Pseudomonadota bacterium]
MWEQLKRHIAVIFDKDGGVAGTGFAISGNLLLICSHIVRDALDLGHTTPTEPSNKDQHVKARFGFPETEEPKDFKLFVAEGGWFPISCWDMSSRYKDIAVNGKLKVHHLCYD